MATPLTGAGTSGINNLEGRAKPSFRDACAGAKVINETILHAGGHDIKFTTKSCVQVTRPLAARLSSLEKRQANVCGVACSVQCEGVTEEPPSAVTCINLGNDLNELSETFVTAPGDFTTAQSGNCAVGFGNLETSDLQFCTSELGNTLLMMVDFCFPSNSPATASSDAVCVPPSGGWLTEGFLVSS
ncbi:hypothetical protein K439DRAFT_1665344 [Ramaria rubella]|nr:hypothetical protein K439DRAFT_1665344 [Ramaria rubella]